MPKKLKNNWWKNCWATAGNLQLGPNYHWRCSLWNRNKIVQQQTHEHMAWEKQTSHIYHRTGVVTLTNTTYLPQNWCGSLNNTTYLPQNNCWQTLNVFTKEQMLGNTQYGNQLRAQTCKSSLQYVPLVQCSSTLPLAPTSLRFKLPGWR